MSALYSTIPGTQALRSELWCLFSTISPLPLSRPLFYRLTRHGEACFTPTPSLWALNSARLLPSLAPLSLGITLPGGRCLSTVYREGPNCLFSLNSHFPTATVWVLEPAVPCPQGQTLLPILTAKSLLLPSSDANTLPSTPAHTDPA